MDLQSIIIESTDKTSPIDFNHLTGELILSGRSIPENATEIYEPVLKWVDEYINIERNTTNLRLILEYFNTSSSIWIAKTAKSLSKMKNPDNVLFEHLYFHIEEYDNMEEKDLKDALNPVIDIIHNAIISMGIKIYGTDEKGEILKESMVLI
jgi:hypothetical protein